MSIKYHYLMNGQKASFDNNQSFLSSRNIEDSSYTKDSIKNNHI